eukprot:SAG22_NODE_1563_length_4114_cov_6.143711_1_plen_239_part_00
MRAASFALVLAAHAFQCGAAAAASGAVGAAEGSAAGQTEAARGGNILVVYFSVSNHTKALAEAVAEGAKSVPGATVRLQSTAETTIEDVLGWSDALILGSPVHYGNPAAGLLSWVEMEWEHAWTDPRFTNKLGAVFATGGGMAQGVEHVLACLQRLLWSFRVKVITPNPTRSGYDSYGAVAVTGTYPYNSSLMACPDSRVSCIAAPFVQAGIALGVEVAKAATGAKTADEEQPAARPW